MKTKYNIFISYRRNAFETANLLATRLKAMGYSVFFDLEEMNQGKFNEQLIERIKECKDFIIVLPPNALDRCQAEDDWVRMEIIAALSNHKNIIPVMLEGFEWPEKMPQGMEELRLFQSITPLPITYYDMQVKRIKTYLTSRPRNRIMRIISIIATVLLLILAGLLIAEECIYRPTAKQFASEFTVKMVCIDGVTHAIEETAEVWNKYAEKVKASTDSAEINQLSESMRKSLINDTNYLARNRNAALMKQMAYTPIQLTFLNYRGIAMDEVSACLQFESDFYYYADNSYKHYLLALKAMNDPLQYKSHVCNAQFEGKMAMHIAETMTYGYLYDISCLSTKAQDVYYSVKIWRKLPMHTGIRLTRDEYLRFQENAMSDLETTVITYDVTMKSLKEQTN